MKISYAITVCNELEEVKRLVNFLLSHKRTEDEIVILYDLNGSKEVYDYIDEVDKIVNIFVAKDNFTGHFADWKNKLTLLCKGDYIFQIDADEIPNLTLIEHLPEILEMNQGVDVLLVPRVNTVEGLTQEHIQKWGWVVDNQGWVNYPDFQWRIYKNTPDIKWINKVHERLIGYKTISNLPQIEECSLYHPKTIERQEKQNNYYDTL
jgi:hypothetical protein